MYSPALLLVPIEKLCCFFLPGLRGGERQMKRRDQWLNNPSTSQPRSANRPVDLCKPMMWLRTLRGVFFGLAGVTTHLHTTPKGNWIASPKPWRGTMGSNLFFFLYSSEPHNSRNSFPTHIFAGTSFYMPRKGKIRTGNQQRGTTISNDLMIWRDSQH